MKAIHTKDRQEMQLKLSDVTTEKDDMRSEFTAKEVELQQLVKKAEKETIELRDVYEKILADMKHELGKYQAQ